MSLFQTPPGWEKLAFEDRQKNWGGHLRHFRQYHGRNERPMVWEIWFDNGRVFTRYGLLGGAMQETNYVGKAKNSGRSNAITAEQDAIAEARRDARKKWDFEGYDEHALPPGSTDYAAWYNIDCRNENLSVQALLTNLPGSFCLYKPGRLHENKKLLEKAKKGEVVYTLKRDGIAHWVVVDYYGNVVIYSRRSRMWSDTEEPKELPDGTLDYLTAVPWARRFPHLVEAVQALKLPRGSMMAVELVAPFNTGENFRYVSGLTKGHTARALEDQQKNGLPMFYWWDLPFYDGRDLLATESTKKRHALLRHLWGSSDSRLVYDRIQPITDTKFATPDEAVAYAKENKLEGWVVVDPEAIYGDKGWSLKGKPDRPNSVAKVKPVFEDDFVAYWDPDQGLGEWGTGRHEAGKNVTLPDGRVVTHGGVGSVALYQYNDKGELTYISNCASGMDYTFQAQLRKEHFPMVCEIEYTERTYISEGEKTNALKFPTFTRLRPDKRADECINERL